MDSLNKGVNNVKEDDNKILGFTDYDLANVVHHYCGGLFVCCSVSDNIWYEFKDHHWVSCNSGTSLRNFISKTLRARYVAVAENLIKVKKAKPSKKIDRMLHIIGTVTEKFGKTNDKNNIMRECRELFYKSDFEERLNENVHLICFTNGIFDSNTTTFRDGTPDDMCSMTTGVPLLPLTEEEETYKRDILQRMIYDPLGEAVGDYFLLNIALALVGKRMKRIMFGLGTSDAGKSTICKATLNSFAEYAYTFNAGCLAHSNTTQDEAQRMRWTLLIAKKRIIFSNEMKSNASLDGEMIKKISGGDHIVGRGHCQNEVKYLLDFLTVCMANDLPKITPYGEALSTRVRVIPYEKKYVPNPTNDMD
jgi:phage/plasmid-associated DNA primase